MRCAGSSRPRQSRPKTADPRYAVRAMIASELPYSPTRLDALRRRTVWSLVASVALGSVGYIAALTVATIVARDLAGSTAWSGAPGAGVVLGSAIGSTLLSRLMATHG